MARRRKRRVAEVVESRTVTARENSGPDSVMETAASRGEKGVPLVLRAMGSHGPPGESDD
jgi:hypothetical protein